MSKMDWFACRALRTVLLAASLAAGAPAGAQVGAAQDAGASGQEDPIVLQPQQQVAPLPPAGRVAKSSAGEVGKRQAPGDMAAGVSSNARIANRIQNRVETRIRNRIDRNYDPQANATDPFAVAAAQARAAR